MLKGSLQLTQLFFTKKEITRLFFFGGWCRRQDPLENPGQTLSTQYIIYNSRVCWSRKYARKFWDCDEIDSFSFGSRSVSNVDTYEQFFFFVGISSQMFYSFESFTGLQPLALQFRTLLRSPCFLLLQSRARILDHKSRIPRWLARHFSTRW